MATLLNPPQMTIRVLLFAQYSEIAGIGELSLDLPDSSTVAGVVEALRARPGMEGLPIRPAVALNRTVVGLDVQVHEGDEVALLPPVAGG